MKTGVPNKQVKQQFFHKLHVEPDNSLIVKGLKQALSAAQDNSAAYNGFQNAKHVERIKRIMILIWL